MYQGISDPYLEEASPMYCLKQCTESTYIVIRYKGAHVKRISYEPAECEHHDEKLGQSYSRAKSQVKQLGLSNPWEYFFTGTLDRKKYNRWDITIFDRHFKQWIRDQRKKGADIKFVFVPERHKNGAWHIHGMLFGIPSDWLEPFDEIAKRQAVPKKLIGKGYLNWSSYQEKFGFCSLAPIRDVTACSLYILKYIMKDLSGEWGKHLYSCSRNGLSRAVPVAYDYEQNLELDTFIEHEAKFVDSGLATDKDWFWPFEVTGDCERINVEDIETPKASKAEKKDSYDAEFDYYQGCVWDD